jgi:hypothetical protein
MFDQILWQCTMCDTVGTVTGWRLTGDDLSEFVPTLGQPPLTIGVSDMEYVALSNATAHMAEEAAVVAAAQWTGDEVVISAPLDAIRFLADELATEFNRSSDPRQRKHLWAVCMRIDALASKPI